MKQYRQHIETIQGTHWNTIRGNTLKQWWQPPQTIQTTSQTIQATYSAGSILKQYRQNPQTIQQLHETIQATPLKNTGTPQRIQATPSNNTGNSLKQYRQLPQTMMATAPDNTGNTLKQYRQYHQTIQATPWSNTLIRSNTRQSIERWVIFIFRIWEKAQEGS